MKTSELAELVAIYGNEKATKAALWFGANFNYEFRFAIDAVKFIKNNEYLWSN